MLYFSDSSYVTFSQNLIKQVLLTNQKLEINIPQIFNKMYINFQRIQN